MIRDASEESLADLRACAGWLTNPRRAAYNRAYNRVYNRTTKGCAVLVGVGLVAAAAAATGLILIA